MVDAIAEDGIELGRGQPSVAEITQYLKQSQEKQKKYRWWNRAATIALAVILIIYIFLFYGMFSNNLAAEKFNENIQKTMITMGPSITDATIEVIAGVSPLYLELARKKADDIAPAFVGSLEEQTNLFVGNMAAYAQQDLHAALLDVAEKVAGEFRRQYPDLTDQQIEQFINDTDREIQALFVQITEQIFADTMPQITEMKHLAESMGEKKDLPTEPMEMYRLLLHKLLILLDQAIMEG